MVLLKWTYYQFFSINKWGFLWIIFKFFFPCVDWADYTKHCLQIPIEIRKFGDDSFRLACNTDGVLNISQDLFEYLLCDTYWWIWDHRLPPVCLLGVLNTLNLRSVSKGYAQKKKKKKGYQNSNFRHCVSKSLSLICIFSPFHGTGIFPYPLKISENHRFLMFSGGIERDKRHEMV